ncbi:MAG TPA: hypothetical protein PKA63_02020 [Oligoflexia bacterium]|nr:hypothetical protein [Oligoflexia bacterium]HMP47427.1 hypothetical protein [Oligoflexia bacterium]
MVYSLNIIKYVTCAIMLGGLGGISEVMAQCSDGRVPCSHKCDNSQRPACTDSKGALGKAYCTTAAFCRDGGGGRSQCDSGWSASGSKCSQSDRARGCQDKRANSGGGYCVRYK